MEFESCGRQDERGGDGPEVVGGPAEADDYEELGMVLALLYMRVWGAGRRCRASYLPLIPPHANILNRFIQDPSFSLIHRIQ